MKNRNNSYLAEIDYKTDETAKLSDKDYWRLNKLIKMRDKLAGNMYEVEAIAEWMDATGIMQSWKDIVEAEKQLGIALTNEDSNDKIEKLITLSDEIVSIMVKC